MLVIFVERKIWFTDEIFMNKKISQCIQNKTIIFKIVSYIFVPLFALKLLKNSGTSLSWYEAWLRSWSLTKPPHTLICTQVVFNASFQSETEGEDQRLELKNFVQMFLFRSLPLNHWVNCKKNFVSLHFSSLSNEIRQRYKR